MGDAVSRPGSKPPEPLKISLKSPVVESTIVVRHATEQKLAYCTSNWHLQCREQSFKVMVTLSVDLVLPRTASGSLFEYRRFVKGDQHDVFEMSLAI